MLVTFYATDVPTEDQGGGPQKEKEPIISKQTALPEVKRTEKFARDAKHRVPET